MLFKYFLQPFPLVQTHQQKFRIILAVSIFVLFFHGAFEPFGIRTYDQSTKVMVVLAYTLICGIVLSINFFAFPKLLPAIFKPEKWNNISEFLWILWNIVTVALCTFWFKTSLGFYPANVVNLINVLVSATAIGAIPASLYILINRLNYHKNILPATKPVAPSGKLMDQKIEIIRFKADRGGGQLGVDRSGLLYLVSDHNYVLINTLKRKEEVEVQKLRGSISSMEEVLSKYPEFYRCHRAFIINVQFIESLNGNVKNCYAKLLGADEAIPVSRQYVHELRKLVSTK